MRKKKRLNEVVNQKKDLSITISFMGGYSIKTLLGITIRNTSKADCKQITSRVDELVERFLSEDNPNQIIVSDRTMGDLFIEVDRYSSDMICNVSYNEARYFVSKVVSILYEVTPNWNTFV